MTASWPFGDMRPLSFDMLMVDPPWRFEAWSEAGKIEKAPEVHYKTLTCDQIVSRFPVGHLAARDAVLWLWGTHPMIDQQIDVARRWGFRFATTGVWVKRTKNGLLGFGTGYRLRSASEPFIIAVNGDPSTARNIRTVIEGPLRRHSEKPEEAYAAAEAMFPHALHRADIFSRTTRPGWTAWGDEAGKFDTAA